jgi:hypothetical protein
MAVHNVINFNQINLHHYKETSSVLRRSFDSEHIVVSLIQELYFFRGKVRELGDSGVLHYVVNQDMNSQKSKRNSFETVLNQ